MVGGLVDLLSASFDDEGVVGFLSFVIGVGFVVGVVEAIVLVAGVGSFEIAAAVGGLLIFHGLTCGFFGLGAGSSPSTSPFFSPPSFASLLPRLSFLLRLLFLPLLLLLLLSLLDVFDDLDFG